MTEKQQKFLDALFGEAEGDPLKAKRIAGYSENTPTQTVMEPLRDQIMEKTKVYLTTYGPRAAHAIGSIVNTPTQLGSKEKLAAATKMLEFGGYKASEKVEVTPVSPVFILPEKKVHGETDK